MEIWKARISIFVLVSSSAAFTAVAIGYIVHEDFGISHEAIRTDALLCAALIASLLAIEFFGRKSGTHK